MNGQTNQICTTCGGSKLCLYAGVDGPECQNCYRRRKRRERGLQVPGPTPDPDKPASRHNPLSTHHAWKDRRETELQQPEAERKFLRVGDTCSKGHVLTEESLRQAVEGDRDRLRCRQCEFEKRLNRSFKMRPHHFWRLWDEQEGCCAICRQPFPPRNSGRVTPARTLIMTTPPEQ